MTDQPRYVSAKRAGPPARALIPAAALALLALGGCAAEMVDALYYRTGIYDYFVYGGRDGTFPVAIAGNPFSVDKGSLEGIVTGAMKDSHQGPRVRFVALGPDQRPHIRIAIMFDPPALVSDGAPLCRDLGALTPARRNGRIGIIAAFCVGDQVQSRVIGSMASVASPDDAAFRRLIEAVTLNILPIIPPERGSNIRI